MSRAFAVLLVAITATLATAQQDPPPAPSATERAETQLQQGHHEEAISVLREALAPDRAAVAERTMLARVLAWLGRNDEGFQVLEQGLRLGTKDDDSELQWLTGSQWRALGNDGPFYRREGRHVVYLPPNDKVDEKAWRNERYRKALTAFQAVLAHRPDWDLAHQRVGEMQTNLEQHDAALQTWTAAAERFPLNGSLQLGRARALRELGRAVEAAAACKTALQSAPRLAEAHELMAEILEQDGKNEAAQLEREQARFYEWAPAFLELDFATVQDSFRKLAPHFDEEPAEQVLEQAQKERAAEVERLLQTANITSSRLLGTLCFNHTDHDIEDRLFAALQARGAESIAVLRPLLEHAQTTCTTKGAARALAILRAPGILATLLELLPDDVRAIWNGDIAGALAELGDPAAVPALVESADLADAARTADDDPMERQGRDSARQRAVLALGVLGGDAARAALHRGLQHELLGASCRVALYRLTRDDAMVEAVRKTVLAATSLQRQNLLAYLEAFAPDLAKELRGTKK